ncbi:hypothetical protein SGRI78S_00935 [Streptomyces griseus subsp. griseus]
MHTGGRSGGTAGPRHRTAGFTRPAATADRRGVRFPAPRRRDVRIPSGAASTPRRPSPLRRFPLIARRTERRYEAAAGTSPDVYFGNWLLITGALFALSALWLLFRALRSRPGRRSETKVRPSAPH